MEVRVAAGDLAFDSAADCHLPADADKHILVSGQRSVIEVMHAMFHVRLVHRKSVERRSVICVAPHITRIRHLVPVRGPHRSIAAQKVALSDSWLIYGLLDLVYHEPVASSKGQIASITSLLDK